MAGSDEFKKELSQAARNRLTREAIGNDPDRLAKRLSIVDRNKYDFSGFTDKQINMALQGSMFGDDDYARLTGKPVGYDKPVAAPAPTPKPTPKPVQEDPSNDIGNGPGMDRPMPTPEIPTVIERPVVEEPTFGLDTGTGSFNVGRIDANIGKRGDMTTSIGDNNTFGSGASIGNDTSTTIGSQMFGNSLSLPPRREEPTFGLDTGSGSYNVGRIDANIGKEGDMNTSIGDGNTFGAGVSIGNDMSTTIGSQMFGNSLSLPRRRMAEQGAFAGLVFN